MVATTGPREVLVPALSATQWGRGPLEGQVKVLKAANLNLKSKLKSGPPELDLDNRPKQLGPSEAGGKTGKARVWPLWS